MISEKAAILFNPSSGGGKALKKKNRLETLLRQFEIPCDLIITQSVEELKNLSRELPSRYRTLAGAGGDSTFHMIINELWEAGADVNFGMIGMGSSNDIAKEFGLDSLEKACLALKRGKTKKIDLGRIMQGQAQFAHFLGQANVGLGAVVNQYVSQLTAKHRALGKMQALAGFLGIVHSYRKKIVPVPLRVESDTGRHEGEFLLAVISNIRYWATGKIISPDAQPDDGLLDACLIRKCTFPRLAYLAHLAKKGKLEKASEVTVLRSRSFEITSEKPFEIQTDGELLGGSTRPAQFKKIQFITLPKALNVLV